MLFGIICVMIICAALGVPPLPVAIVSALVMVGAAYFVSKDKRIRKIGMSYVMIVTTIFMMRGMSTNLPPDTALPAWVLSYIAVICTDGVIETISVVTIIYSAFLGIFGPMQGVATTMDGIIKQINDAPKE